MIAARARSASFASTAVGNAVATSGSRTTTELPTAYRDAYLFRGAPRKSYSGKISSAGIRRLRIPLLTVFFIVSPLTPGRDPGTDDPNGLAAVDEHHREQAFVPRKPGRTNRSSSEEWRASATTRPRGSPKTVAASSKETACFAKSDAAFCRSHSKSSATAQYTRLLE